MSVLVALGPAATSCAALTQLATVRRWPGFAFTLGLCVQPLWAAFAIVTGQYGFLIACGPFAVVNALQLRGVVRARRRSCNDMQVAEGVG